MFIYIYLEELVRETVAVNLTMVRMKLEYDHHQWINASPDVTVGYRSIIALS